MNISLQSLRKKLNYSVDMVSNHLDISRSTLYRYENGDLHKMNISTFLELSKLYCIDPLVLLGLSEESKTYTVELELPFEPSPEEVEQALTYLYFIHESKNKK